MGRRSCVGDPGMPDVLVQDRLVASVGIDGDMAAAKQHGKSVVVFADADRIVVMVWEEYRGRDAFLMGSDPFLSAHAAIPVVVVSGLRAPYSCIAYAARSWNQPAMFSGVTS